MHTEIDAGLLARSVCSTGRFADPTVALLRRITNCSRRMRSVAGPWRREYRSNAVSVWLTWRRTGKSSRCQSALNLVVVEARGASDVNHHLMQDMHDVEMKKEEKNEPRHVCLYRALYRGERLSNSRNRDSCCDEADEEEAHMPEQAHYAVGSRSELHLRVR